jgi:transcription termination/antitermination protein NusG
MNEHETPPEAETLAETESLTAEHAAVASAPESLLSLPQEHAPAADPAVTPMPAMPAAPAEPESKKRWYVVKVASGQEESIKARLERKIKVEGIEVYIGQIVIPVERVTEVKKVKKTVNGEKVTSEKRVIKEKKKYPGYLMAEVEYCDAVQYLFRETPGVGDFVGGGLHKPPAPMSDREVAVMLGTELSSKDGGTTKGPGKKIKVKIDLEKGDKVRLRDGAFAGTEGEVTDISEAKDDTETPKISVKVQLWGRDVNIDKLEYWQVDKV